MLLKFFKHADLSTWVGQEVWYHFSGNLLISQILKCIQNNDDRELFEFCPYLQDIVIVILNILQSNKNDVFKLQILIVTRFHFQWQNKGRPFHIVNM